MKPNPIKFDDKKIPAWTYKNCKPSMFTFVTAIALADLEEVDIRLSAKMQRRLLGRPILGKQKFRVRNDGTINIWAKTSYGTDWHETTIHSVELQHVLASGKVISATYSGRRYYDSRYDNPHSDYNLTAIAA